MSYLLYQEDKIVGVFDSHQKATDMAQGVIDNGWAKNFRVVEYKLNSCCKVKETKVDDDDDDEDSTTTEDIELNSEEIKKEKKEESELQSQLNVLKSSNQSKLLFSLIHKNKGLISKVEKSNTNVKSSSKDRMGFSIRPPPVI